MNKWLKYGITCILIFLLFSCNGENAFRQEKAVCTVGTKYFVSIQSAIDYLSSSAKATSADREITVIQDIIPTKVLDSQRGSITVPETLSDRLIIDLNGHTYEFSGNSYFKSAGSSAEIRNGNIIIPENKKSSSYAVNVSKGELVLSGVTLKDQRIEQKTVSISNGSVLTIKSSDKSNGNISGSFNLSDRAKLEIKGGTVNFSSITEPQSSVANILIYSGKVSNTHELNNRITSAIDAVSEADKGEIIRSIVHSPVKYIQGIAATCFEQGNSAYYICEAQDCGKFFSDKECLHEITDKSSVILEKLTHRIEKVNAVAPTCTTSGNQEYYSCRHCGTFFADNEGINVIDDRDSVIIPALGHSIEFHDSVASTCIKHGYESYYQCSLCEKYFADGIGNKETTSPSELPLSDHSWIKIAYTKEQHWVICNDCYQEKSGTRSAHSYSGDWSPSDEDGKYERKCSYCPQKEYTDACIWHEYEEKEPTCTEDGNIAYSYCEVHKDYYSADKQTLIDWTEIQKKAYGHADDGKGFITDAEYHWNICSRCGNRINILSHSKDWSSDTINHWWICKDCNYSSVLVPHTYSSWSVSEDEIATKTCTETECKHKVSTEGYKLIHVPANPADCTHDGRKAYYTCEALDDGFVFNADRTEVITYQSTYESIKPHEPVKVEAKDATCLDEGYDEHYRCSTCGSLFSDSNALNEITESQILRKKTDHVFENNNWSYDNDSHWSACIFGCGEYRLKNIHTWGDWKVISIGVAERECSVCHYKLSTADKKVLIHEKAPTPEADGNIEYYYCKEFDLYLSSTEPKLIYKEDTVLKYGK